MENTEFTTENTVEPNEYTETPDPQVELETLVDTLETLQLNVERAEEEVRAHLRHIRDIVGSSFTHNNVTYQIRMRNGWPYLAMSTSGFRKTKKEVVDIEEAPTTHAPETTVEPEVEPTNDTTDFSTVSVL